MPLCKQQTRTPHDVITRVPLGPFSVKTRQMAISDQHNVLIITRVQLGYWPWSAMNDVLTNVDTATIAGQEEIFPL